MFDNLFALEMIKAAVFFSMFMVSAVYLIPKGIIFCLEWKEKRTYRYLSTGVTFISGGVLLLIYLIGTAIAQHVLMLVK